MEPNPRGGLTSAGADQLNPAAEPRLHKVRRQPGWPRTDGIMATVASFLYFNLTYKSY